MATDKKSNKDLKARPGDPPGQVELFPDHNPMGLFEKVRERASQATSLMSVTSETEEDELESLFLPGKKKKKANKTFDKPVAPKSRFKSHLSEKSPISKLEESFEKVVSEKKEAIENKEIKDFEKFSRKIDEELKLKKDKLKKSFEHQVKDLMQSSKERLQVKLDRKLKDAQDAFEKMKDSASKRLDVKRKEILESENKQVNEYAAGLKAENEEKIKQYKEKLVENEKSQARDRIKKRLVEEAQKMEDSLDMLFLDAKRASKERVKRYQEAESEAARQRIDAEREKAIIDTEQKILSLLEKEEKLIENMKLHRMSESEREAYDRIQNKISPSK